MIEIPLSKKGKNAGRYIAIVDDCDSDLAQLNWSVCHHDKKHTPYANRHYSRKSGGKVVSLHQEIALRIFPEIPEGYEIDHINRNGLDNSRKNLRLVTHSQNMINRGMMSNNTSGYRGVSWKKETGKWVARIRVNKNLIHIGYFDDPAIAYEAYLKKAEELHIF